MIDRAQSDSIHWVRGDGGAWVNNGMLDHRYSVDHQRIKTTPAGPVLCLTISDPNDPSRHNYNAPEIAWGVAPSSNRRSDWARKYLVPLFPLHSLAERILALLDL